MAKRTVGVRVSSVPVETEEGPRLLASVSTMDGKLLSVAIVDPDVIAGPYECGHCGREIAPDETVSGMQGRGLRCEDCGPFPEAEDQGDG